MYRRREFLVLSGAALGAAAIPPSLALSQNAPTLPWDRNFRRIVDPEGRVIVEAIDLRLTQEMVSPGRSLVVRADVVRLHGAIRTEGGSVSIFARRLIASETALLDTSGNTGRPDFTNRPRAPDGTKPGERGQTGRNGGNGDDAGDIVIAIALLTGALRIAAIGGRGGRGENGGYGAKGATGTAGLHPGNDGGPGEMGGAPGRAGSPGHGGDGGSVTVWSLAPISLSSVPITNYGGKGSEPAQHGQPGAPGDGGPGKSGRVSAGCKWECDPRLCK